MITRLGAVPVFVSDCDRAIDFWRDRVGLQVAMDVAFGEDGRWVTVAPGPDGAELILYQPTRTLAGDDADELKNRIGVWTGIIFFTDAIDQTHAELSRRGVEFRTPPTRQFWGGWEALFVDPDGNRFHLVQRPDAVCDAGVERAS